MQKWNPLCNQARSPRRGATQGLRGCCPRDHVPRRRRDQRTLGPEDWPSAGGGGVGVWKIPRAGGKGGMPHFRSEGPRAITSPCEAVRGFGRISPSSWPPSCVRGPVPLAVAERPPPAFGDATWAAPRSRSASLSREGGASPNGAAP